MTMLTRKLGLGIVSLTTATEKSVREATGRDAGFLSAAEGKTTRQAKATNGAPVSVGKTKNPTESNPGRQPSYAPERGFRVEGVTMRNGVGVPFEVKVIGGKWKIQTVTLPSGYSPQEKIIIVGDGYTVYEIRDFSNLIKKAIASGQKLGVNWSESMVSDIGVPVEHSHVSPIWMAFCSESYFKNLKTNFIYLPTCENIRSGDTPFGLAALRYRQTSYWNLNQQPPYCPKDLWSVDDGIIKYFAGKARYPAPYSLGFTNFTFTVQEYLDLEEFEIPKKAEINIYSLFDKGKFSGPMRKLHCCALVVNRAALCTDAIEFPPSFSGITTVRDGRAMVSNQVDIVHYMSTNRFLSTEEFKQTKEYQKMTSPPSSWEKVELIKIKIGEVTPDFEVNTLEGKPVKLADLRGKLVLLNFWATFCRPCLMQLPYLKQVYDRFGKEPGFVIVNLSSDEDPQTVRQFIQTNSMPGVQGFLGDWGSTNQVRASYGVVGMPALILIGPDGKVIAKDTWVTADSLLESVERALHQARTSTSAKGKPE